MSRQQLGGGMMKFRMLILSAIILFAFVLPVIAAEEPEFIWTKQYPKPSWWKWGKEYYPEKPVRGGYFRVSATRGVGLMNPNHWPVNNWVFLAGIYDRLIFPDGDHRAVVPWLAKYWEYESDLAIKMKLRKGVKFHDGTEFNAHGLKYQTDWILDRKSGAWSRNWLRPLKSIEVIDDYTVRWHLKEQWAGFFDIFANVPGWLISTKALKADVAMKSVERLKGKIKLAEKKVSKAEKKAKKTSGKKAKKAAKKLKKERKKLARLNKQMAEAQVLAKGAKSLDEWAVGSGPWMVEEVSPDNKYVTKRNPNWWFGKAVGKPDMPYFDGNITIVIPENSVKLANLKAGKIDTLGIQKSQYSQVKDDPKLDVWITPLNFNIYCSFNHKSVFKDIRLRKAVSHAIDRKALIAANEGGFGRVASCFFPEDHFAHNPNLKPIKYDPELSRRLVKEAGYPNGLKIKGVLYSGGPARRYGAIIAAMLKAVNITWELEFLEPVAAADKYRNLEYDMGTIVGIYIKDPDSVMTNTYAPEENTALARTYNEEVIKLIAAARKELDFEKRKKMYWEVERLLYEDYTDAWLYYYTHIEATRKQVRGYAREMSLVGGEAYWATHPQWFKDGIRD